MDRCLKKCIIEQNNLYEFEYSIHHTSEYCNKLEEKIKGIKGVFWTYVINKYEIMIKIGKCFNAEMVIDEVMKTVLCFDLNNKC